jgi:ABC-type uncharacterized transport system involved in gliding motility auxiliary subunit
MPRPVGWNEILKPFGVSVNSDMAYDLASSEVVPTRAAFGPFQVMQRYPFFIRSKSTRASIVNRDLAQAFMPWTSSLDTTRAAAGTVTPLLVTSEASGVSTGPTMLEPGRTWERTSLAPRVLAVQVTPRFGGDTTQHGRVIVVGGSEFINDRLVRSAPENLAFVLNAVDWLAQDDALIAIRSANRRPPSLAFTSAAAREGVKYANVIGVPALVALAGLLRIARRRRRTRAPYQPLSAPAAGAAAGAAS